MEFIAADGTTQTGEVWSPGPEARSVWVLLADGTPKAVKLPTKAGRYKHAEPAREIASRCGAVRHSWLAHKGHQQLLLEARYAQQLPEKLWREALAS